MRSSRARFKYAPRQCRHYEQKIANEKLANHMKHHELNDFLKDARKHGKTKYALPNCIDGVIKETAMIELIT